MSEIPETPTGAVRALIGWFAGALAFESGMHMLRPVLFGPLLATA
jgi:hypothetical protein